MLRLRQYLKPYTLIIGVVIALLFAQAMLDLALPDYLARIVNTGVQLSGIETAVPEALRQERLEQLVLFMSDEDETAVREAFTLVETGSAEANNYIETYPTLAQQSIYVLNDLSRDQIDQLNAPLARSWVVVAALEQAMKDPEAAAQMFGGGDAQFDLSRIPPGTDLFAMISQLPAVQRDQIGSAITERIDSLGASFIDQAAVAGVKAEYEALGRDVTQLQTRYILRTGAIMLVITLLSALCTIGVAYLAARVASGSGRDLRSAVFKKVESFSSAEFDQFPTASLITRNTNDITQLQMMTVITLRLVFYAPILGVGGIIRAMRTGPSMWWTIALAVVILIGVIITLISIALPRFRIMQKLVDRLNLVARENLSGMLVVRAFNMEPFEEERFDKANDELAANTLFVGRLMAIMMPIMMLILNVLSITILWVGAHQVELGTMQVGDMMAFLQYALQIVMAFLMMSMLFILLPRAAVSADRVADVLETEPIILDPAQPVRLNGDFRGKVEFRNVSFRYPGADEDVLHNISFSALPGETTAFIGSTGSGKSTVVNLIPRFYDVTEGEILLDDIDIRTVTQHELRDRIGYIPQRGVLFSGTIASNLRYANEFASDDELLAAVATAQAVDFVGSKPEGLNTEISQGGTNVSGGQRQRLSIARALVKDAPIYIFDDTFSALDFKTDAALRRALNRSVGQSTKLVVTQRVATIKDAEQIIVLDNGRVVGQGTHEELMEDCETYQEIALSQLSMEELQS